MTGLNGQGELFGRGTLNWVLKNGSALKRSLGCRDDFEVGGSPIGSGGGPSEGAEEPVSLEHNVSIRG